MRLEGYLKEEDPVISDRDLIIARLKIDCKKFLQETDGIPVYRGVIKRLPHGMSRKTSHIEAGRKPRDATPEIHDYLNNLFKKKFGWPVRNGVFVSGNWSQVESYGDAYIFFPIGDYEYAWSPGVDDLWSFVTGANVGYTLFGHGYSADDFAYLKGLKTYEDFETFTRHFRDSYRAIPAPKKMTFDEFMDTQHAEADKIYKKVVDSYRDNDLKTALKMGAGREISFNCKNYWLLSNIIYNDIKGQL